MSKEIRATIAAVSRIGDGEYMATVFIREPVERGDVVLTVSEGNQ